MIMTDLINAMNADYQKLKTTGNNVMAERVQCEMAYAIANPALYELEISVREVFDIPSLGMTSPLRSSARKLV